MLTNKLIPFLLIGKIPAVKKKFEEQGTTHLALGRTVSRSFTGGIQTSYEYYLVNGLVKAVATSDGIITRFEYDDLDRLRLRKDSIDINNIFTSEYSYSGSTDRIDSVMLNGSVKLKYQYNTNEYLSGVAAGNKTVWTAGSMNRYGIVNNFTLGNQAQTVISYDDYGFINGISTTKSGTPIQSWSYEFNTTTGNLLSRTGLSSADTTISEYFTYDDLDRLLTYRIAQDTMKVSYDAAGTGNITGKSDAGTYGYNSGVHRVDSVTNPSEWFLDRPYQEVEYNEFNKVSHIRDSVDGGVRELQITYGPSEQRVKTVYSENGQVIVTKYFAPGYEKEVYIGGLTRELYYISATDGVVAMLERKSGMDTLYYIHKDHLGSIDVITDPAGNIKQRCSFDPWGRRRNPADWSYENVPGDSFIDMGFTGHEHLDQFGLINMNGRVYDPLMAMFLSPDNFIQSPDLTQNYNRYAYCLNNPLKYFDPSGYRRVPDPPSHEEFINIHLGGSRNQFNYRGSAIEAYTLAVVRGYGGGYGNFSDQYWNQYYGFQFSSGGNGIIGGGSPSSMSFTYYTKSQSYGELIEISGYKSIREVIITEERHTILLSFGNSPQGQGGGFWGHALTFTDNHFNGGLSTVGVSVQAYNKIPNDIKRAYAYKLSKMTGIKSGQIFQGAKGFANGIGKLVSKLGPVGTVLGVGVISYEVGTNTWDAHTIVNGTLMVGAGVAAAFAAPAVLTGIAVYGVGDYFFDFGDIIDNNIGRKSGVW